jgi:GDP-mannose transporter
MLPSALGRLWGVGVGGGDRAWWSPARPSSMAGSGDKNKPRRRHPKRQEELASGAAFCAASLAMTLLNKAALSPRLARGAPAIAPPVICLLAFQCACTLGLTYAACALGFGRAPPCPSARVLRLWLPVNALFAAMVATSFLALRHLGVPMLTVLKNLTSLLVIAGDRVLFGKTYGRGVWLTLGLMTASALCAAASDLEFSAAGYAWQLANNVATAAYSLALRLAIVRMRDEDGGEAEGKKRSSVGGEVEDGLSGGALSSFARNNSPKTAPTPPNPNSNNNNPNNNDVGMVIYNNMGALPLLVLLAVASGEPGRLGAAPPGALRATLADRRLVAASLASSVGGFLLSVASMWFMRCTTATTFSLVGSLNKVPLAILGAALFAPPPGKQPAWASPWHVASVAVGLLAGAVFARAKGRSEEGSGGGGGVGGVSGAGRRPQQQQQQQQQGMPMRRGGSPPEGEPLLAAAAAGEAAFGAHERRRR